MTLHVYSARITYRGVDRLDVTRKSGREGIFLAPSWDILVPALEARRQAIDLLQRATIGQYDPKDAAGDAAKIEAEAWDAYVPAYLAEMRASYRKHRTKWESPLARSTVILVCYCTDPVRCHRAILRAHILPKLGAVDCGEIE